MKRSATLRGRAGAVFTLIELIVASVVAAVFFLGVFSIVLTMLDQRQHIEESALPYNTAPAVLDRLTEDLRNAVYRPYNGGDVFHAERENVNGEEVTRLQFVAAVSSRRKFEVDREQVRAYINEIGWRCRRSETRDGLIAIYRREDPGVDDKPLEGGKYAKVVDGVVAFSIDFFPNDPGSPEDEGAKGEEEWDAKKDDGLPWACRITLSLMPQYDTDENGQPVSDVPPEPLEFRTYVVFPTRDMRPKTRAAAAPVTGN
jgi:type II secretory pathway component PulJ